MVSLTSEPIRTRLLLLRHGAVDWSRVEAGEPPLSDAGRADAEIAAATLPRADVIVASPQRPTAETADAIAAYRGIEVAWRDSLDEIRPSAQPLDAAAYADWIDRLFSSYATSDEGEALQEGADRMVASLRAIGDRYYGRSILVVSHPVILLAFRGRLVQAPVQRVQVETMPDLALATVDYLEGRFYLVQDFPIRQAMR
jgi:broad specificity phosphatase PhoE